MKDCEGIWQRSKFILIWRLQLSSFEMFYISISITEKQMHGFYSLMTKMQMPFKILWNTMEARFSGHQFSGKPRFKGHFSENMGDCFFIFST